jgi:2-haloalkanoic acid dehalogenase type II
MARIKTSWVTFDCYGTLIDWEAGIRGFLERALGTDDARFIEKAIEAWEEIQFEMIGAEYQPYAQIMRESLKRTFAGLGAVWRDEAGEEFVRALPQWKPFLGTNPALAALRAQGLKLGIISNIDDRLLAETVRHFSVAFDLLVTAEQARAYKPADTGFRLALERIGLPASEVTHVAFGDRYDLATARCCGMKVVFLNRHAKRVHIAVDAEISDLSELPALFE